MTSSWHHHDSVSNHQPRHCLLNRLFRRRSKKTSRLRVTGLCVGNSPGTGEFPAQMASNAKNASNWWRHHGYATHGIQCRQSWGKAHNVSTMWFIGVYEMNHYFIMVDSIVSGWRLMSYISHKIYVISFHDDIITSKGFPHHWLFVKEICQWHLTKRQYIAEFLLFLLVSLNKLWNKHSICQRFETPKGPFDNIRIFAYQNMPKY